jgi:hypothetical protein
MGIRTKDSSVARRPPVDETVAPIHFDPANGNHPFYGKKGTPAGSPKGLPPGYAAIIPFRFRSRFDLVSLASAKSAIG